MGMSLTRAGLEAEETPLPDGFCVEQQLLPTWVWAGVNMCELGLQESKARLEMCSDISSRAHVGLHPSADLFWKLPNCFT